MLTRAVTLAQSGWRNIANIVLFQIAWAVSVVLGNLYAALTTVVMLAAHHYLIMSTKREWILIAAVVAIGVLVDFLFVKMGVLVFDGTFLVPAWLVCIWLMFATTLCHSLQWLRPRAGLAIVLAAIAGPASYYSGTRLTDAEMGQPLWQSLSILSLWWGALFPTALYATRWVLNES